MRIEWSITKKRGNFRPVLNITIEQTKDELDLEVGDVTIVSSIRRPPESYIPHCRPGRFERLPGFTWDEEYYKITISGETSSGKLTLCWKPGAKPEYPEVEESINRLRNAYEKALKEAYDSGPLEVGGCLELTPETKRHIAPGLTAKRMLKIASK